MSSENVKLSDSSSQPSSTAHEPMRSPLKPVLLLVLVLAALLVFGALDR